MSEAAIKTVSVILTLYIAVSVLSLFWGYKNFVTVSELKFPSAYSKTSGGELVISEGTIEITLAQSGIDALKNPSADISTESIVLSARGEDGSENLTALLLPRAEHGKLVFELGEVRYKGLRAPRFLTGGLRSLINSFAQEINKDFKTNELVLAESKMILIGQSR